MIFKNIPSSRKVVTFDTKRRYVEIFQMISEDQILVKMRPSADSNSATYWSLMNTEGELLEIPPELEEILNERSDWCQLKV